MWRRRRVRQSRVLAWAFRTVSSTPPGSFPSALARFMAWCMASSQACSSAVTSTGDSPSPASPSPRAPASMISPVPEGSWLVGASKSPPSPEPSCVPPSASPDESVGLSDAPSSPLPEAAAAPALTPPPTEGEALSSPESSSCGSGGDRMPARHSPRPTPRRRAAG